MTSKRPAIHDHDHNCLPVQRASFLSFFRLLILLLTISLLFVTDLQKVQRCLLNRLCVVYPGSWLCTLCCSSLLELVKKHDNNAELLVLLLSGMTAANAAIRPNSIQPSLEFCLHGLPDATFVNF